MPDTPTLPDALGETTSIDKQDAMPEAGRKVLHANLKQLIRHQALLESADSVHHIHQMRVTTRRMRSALRVFAPYYRRKTVQTLQAGLRQTARKLGAVRDLDVLTENLRQYAEQNQLDWDNILSHLAKERQMAFSALQAWLTSQAFNTFMHKIVAFVTTPHKGSLVHPKVTALPFRVRHVLPVLFHQQLAHVLAYDNVLPSTHFETLHALRIHCKALRYALNFFDDLLGSTAKVFHDEVKRLQDYLGLLNDAVVAHTRLTTPGWLSPDEIAQLQPYCEQLEQTAQQLVRDFPTVWRTFNTRKVQALLSDAILVLR